MLDLVLLLLALLCLLAAAINVKVGSVSIGWLGLAFYVLRELV